MKKPILIMLLIGFCCCANAQKVNQDSVYSSVDIQPEFPGGQIAFYKYVKDGSKKLLKPNYIGDVVGINAIIEIDGTIKHTKIIKHATTELDSAAVYLLKNSPKWHPGYNNTGYPVRTEKTLLLYFEDQRVTVSSGYYGDYPKTDPDQIYVAVETPPQFPGGPNKLSEYIKSNQQVLPQPTQIPGNVIAQFVVEKDSTISNIKILRTPSDAFAEEAVRLLTKSPKWIPGEQNGKKVRCYYTVVLKFTAMPSE
jgi:hypothetical protein